MGNPTWLSDAVIYEIYPQSFYDSNGDGIGDIEGIIEKLDYVKSVGFNAIWLNPFYESPFEDAGYDVSDFFKVAARYGTNEDFSRLCTEAHKKGIKIICDLVPCHTSIKADWFEKSSAKEKNEYSDYYIWCDNPAAEYDRLTRRDYARDGRYWYSYYEIQPAINYGFATCKEPWQMSPDCDACRKNKRVLLDIIDFWIGLGCDGFRVDMAAHVIKLDPDLSETKRFWREIRAYMDEKYPECVLFPEWSRPKESLDAGFHFDMFLTGGSLFRGERPQENYFNYFRKAGRGVLSRFMDDYLDWLENTVGKGYISFVTGNHDQKRISLGRDTSEIKTVMAFVLTMTGVPVVYYGDEIGMRFIDGMDKEGATVERGGSRTPMQWERDRKNLGFSESDEPYFPVDSSPDAPCVSEAEQDEDSILSTVKRLISLRRAHPALCAEGSFSLFDKSLNYPLVYDREGGEERIRVAINPSGEARVISSQVCREILLKEAAYFDGNSVILPPCSYIIYTV